MLRKTDVFIIQLLRGCRDWCHSAFITMSLLAFAASTCGHFVMQWESLLKVVEKLEKQPPFNWNLALSGGVLGNTSRPHSSWKVLHLGVWHGAVICVSDSSFLFSAKTHSEDTFRKRWWLNRRSGCVSDFLKDALSGCPPPSISTQVEGACAAVVNDVFCVKLRVTGEEPLNPTLLGVFFFPPQFSHLQELVSWCAPHQRRPGIFVHILLS